jgi:hypothetical protein
MTKLLIAAVLFSILLALSGGLVYGWGALWYHIGGINAVELAFTVPMLLVLVVLGVVVFYHILFGTL